MVVAQDASLGRRGAKLKVKRRETIDCVVVEATEKRCVVRSFGQTFAVGCKGLALRSGNVVEVSHFGRRIDGTPMFPGIVRRRAELEAA